MGSGQFPFIASSLKDSDSVSGICRLDARGYQRSRVSLGMLFVHQFLTIFVTLRLANSLSVVMLEFWQATDAGSQSQRRFVRFALARDLPCGLRMRACRNPQSAIRNPQSPIPSPIPIRPIFHPLDAATTFASVSTASTIYVLRHLCPAPPPDHRASRHGIQPFFTLTLRCTYQQR